MQKYRITSELQSRIVFIINLLLYQISFIVYTAVIVTMDTYM